MKKLVAIVAIAALAACAETKAPEEDTMAEDAMAEDTAATAAWTGFEPGTYQVTNAEDETVDVSLNDDGTYSMINAEGETMNGTFEMTGGKGCFDTEGDDEEVMCWTNDQPGEDGSWQATSDDGETVTVRPVES